MIALFSQSKDLAHERKEGTGYLTKSYPSRRPLMALFDTEPANRQAAARRKHYMRLGPVKGVAGRFGQKPRANSKGLVRRRTVRRICLANRKGNETGSLGRTERNVGVKVSSLPKGRRKQSAEKLGHSAKKPVRRTETFNGKAEGAVPSNRPALSFMKTTPNHLWVLLLGSLRISTSP